MKITLHLHALLKRVDIVLRQSLKMAPPHAQVLIQVDLLRHANLVLHVKVYAIPITGLIVVPREQLIPQMALIFVHVPPLILVIASLNVGVHILYVPLQVVVIAPDHALPKSTLAV